MPISLNGSWVHPGKNRPFCLLETQKQHESIIQSIRVPGLSPSPAGRDTSSLLSCYGAAVLSPVWPLAPSPSSSWQPYLELYSYRVVGKTPSFKYNRVNFSSALISQAASSCQTVVCPSVATIYVATLTHSITNDPKEYIYIFFFFWLGIKTEYNRVFAGWVFFVCLFVCFFTQTWVFQTLFACRFQCSETHSDSAYPGCAPILKFL